MKGRYAGRPDALIEDFQFLIKTGQSHPDVLVKRLGYASTQTLARALNNAGISSSGAWTYTRD